MHAAIPEPGEVIFLVCPECGGLCGSPITGSHMITEEDFSGRYKTVECTECGATSKLPANPFAAARKRTQTRRRLHRIDQKARV